MMMFQRQLWLVTKQTFKIRIKTLGYWSLVLSPLLIALVVAVFAFVFTAMSNHNDSVVGLNVDQSLVQTLKADKSIKAEYKIVSDDKKADQLLKHKKIDSYLKQNNTGYELKNTTQGNPIDENAIKQVLNQYSMQRQAKTMNLTNDQLQKLTTAPKMKTQQVSSKGTSVGGETTKTANYILTVGLGIFIFVFLTAYVGMIANEIANEKSSRIMEILLAATSPAVQFFGKLAGIIGLALVHLLIYIIVGLISYQFISHDNATFKMIMSVLNGVDFSFAIITIIMVFFGIVMYLILTAIIAALVNDQSQVQQAVSPITYLAMLGYVLTFMVSNSPDNVIVKILSFVPFTSQTLMPARLGLQLTQPYELWIAIILQILMIIFLSRFGLKVYKKNVLQYNEGNLTKAGIMSLIGLFRRENI